MFRNNRRKQMRNRILAAATGVIIMTFGIWLNYRDSSEEIPTEEAVQQIEIKKETTKAEPSEKDIETDTEVQPETYLIKEVEGVVKVFICNSEGTKELYLITSIPFELLSENDQQLFRKGVTIDTEDDLGKFLENFDS